MEQSAPYIVALAFCQRNEMIIHREIEITKEIKLEVILTYPTSANDVEFSFLVWENNYHYGLVKNAVITCNNTV